MKKLVKNMALFSVCAGLLLPGAASASLQTDLNQSKNVLSGKYDSGTRQFKSISDARSLGSEKEQKPQFSEDTIIIKYKNPLSRTQHSRLGATILKQDSSLKYVVVKVKNKAAQEKALKAYLKNDAVISAQPSVLFQKFGNPDPKAYKQYVNSMLQINKAQSLAGTRKVKVAVIDTGIDVKHPELKSKVISSVNILNPANPGQPDSHGTHVAGIIAGEKNNGVGGYGINPNADILSIDVFGRSWSTNDYTIAQAIDKAIEQGAKVINMSLGSYAPSPLLEETVQKAISKGITIVAAAGNEAWDMPSYPASYEGVISVGSINSKKSLSSYSNFGPTVDIVAPGEEVYSSIYEAEKLSSFRNMSGTSMASPVVAGVASLVLAKNPSLTPAGVEFILKTTAQDMGAKGYDTKFGNGLVNPVSALAYNVKSVPKTVTKTWTDKEILNEAASVGTSEPLAVTKAFTQPAEQHWIQFKVKEGEYIQTALKTAAQYDHKLTVKFFGTNQSQTLMLDSVRDGKSEAKLIKAPFTGTMAIGVKDVNGNYDSSSAKKNHYTLQVSKSDALPEDASTLTNMTAITSVPFSNSDHTFAGADKIDHDYFTFKADGENLFNLKVSGVAGVNSSINVYREDSLFPPQEPGEPVMNDEEKLQMLKEMLEGENGMPGDFTSNRGGAGEGESLYFKGEKDMKYIVKVSNKPELTEENFFFFFGPVFETNLEPESSLTPYTLSLSSSEFTPDEDGYPIQEGEEGEEGDSDLNGDGRYDMEDEILYFERRIEQYKESARPYTLGQSAAGTLQDHNDSDIFTFQAEKSGIYKFNIPKVNGQSFLVEIMRLTTEKLEDGKVIPTFAYVGDNLNWSGMGSLNSQITTGLKKGETYFLQVSPNFFENDFSYQKYNISSSYIYADQSDKYEDNDLMKDQVKNLPADGKVTGNFAMPGDTDAFYFSPAKTGVYSVLAENGTVNPALQAKLPKELFNKVYKIPVIIEDVNRNRKYDSADYENYSIIDSGADSGTTYGSFKAAAGKKYFIVLDQYIDGGTLSLVPYNLTIAAAKTADEDAKSVITNNKPSKPIALKAVNSKELKASGYLNAGVKFGDEDWYVLTLKKDTSVKIDLSAGIESDMSLSLFQNGKLLNMADYYPEGDNETLVRTLKKGTYHIKVRDYFGNSSVKPYELKVTLK
ncbi:subtilisin family serine protease [Peribacillus deserti]|uniref:Subtilisin family serine protease n=1 Tax=Peribacillus deserti TaxID=673318 RepID=A0ABS2QC60_9BACI|nr:S8 family serine peptidase [Peribacillus deserti]MBM7690714.1 subtilisin family serine protease [Peribacillus deserti]